MITVFHRNCLSYESSPGQNAAEHFWREMICTNEYISLRYWYIICIYVVHPKLLTIEDKNVF